MFSSPPGDSFPRLAGAVGAVGTEQAVGHGVDEARLRGFARLDRRGRLGVIFIAARAGIAALEGVVNLFGNPRRETLFFWQSS